VDVAIKERVVARRKETPTLTETAVVSPTRRRREE
jgi:hypothetical protein